MSRAVIIGGFGTGRASVEAASEAFSEHFEEVFPYTFSDVMIDPKETGMAIEDAYVRTVSAGYLALDNALATNGGRRKPERVDAEGGPLKTTVSELMKSTGIKTARMHNPKLADLRSLEDLLSVARFDAGAVAELLAHPISNIRSIGKIAGFDSVETALRHQSGGIETNLIYRTGDVYFDLSEIQEARAVKGGVSVERPEGEHDQLFITPERVLAQELGGNSAAAPLEQSV